MDADDPARSVICPMLDRAMWRWGLATRVIAPKRATRINKARRCGWPSTPRCLRKSARRTGISYDTSEPGTLQLFRTQLQLDATGKDIGSCASTACLTNC